MPSPEPDRQFAAESYDRAKAMENALAEVRAGFDDYYESGDLSRLLNAEAKVRDIYPPVVRR